jgi:hypothetical protein
MASVLLMEFVQWRNIAIIANAVTVSIAIQRDRPRVGSPRHTPPAAR